MAADPTTAARPLDLLACPLDGTALIEASAGTGKTWAICGLVLRLLLERGLEVGQILVVTFTNAATAELRERVRSRLAQALARLQGRGGADLFIDALLQRLRGELGLADDVLARRLELALQSFDEAAIFTIHGFCQRALADAPFVSGMPLAQELLTDDAALRLGAVQDFWRRHVAGDALSPALASLLLEKKDSPQRWAVLVKRAVAKPLARTLWPADLDDDAEPDLAALAAAHREARVTWLAGREDITAIVAEALPRLNGNTYTEASLAAAAADWDRFFVVDDPLVAVGKQVKLDLLTTDRLQPKKGCAPVRQHPFFALADALLARRQAVMTVLARQRLRLLRRLLDEVPAQLRATKRERRVVAFDDMLYNLYQRLNDERAGPALAATLRARFAAALIDEFQDTDPLQWAIFNAVHGGGAAPLFLVGDPKQAIYSFRNADLHTYLRARMQAGAVWSLADNQRSSARLIAGLNGLFGANPRAFVLPGLDYVPVQPGPKPRPRWVDHTLPRAPLQLWALPDGVDGGLLKKPQAQLAAAEACAGEIARLLAAGQRGEITIDDRHLSGGDIAVLVRSHAQGARLREALARLGVASVELSQASVFHSADAEDLERLLRAILEPTRERLLRAALATAMLGLDAAAIAALAGDEAALLARVAAFSAYREQWQRRGIGVMLRVLLAAEGVPGRLLARPDGERRLTNLRHLIESLHRQAQVQGAPEALLRWLQSRRTEDSGDDAAQLRLESDRHLVRIVTVHRAKGLEYPVVFCPMLWDGHPGGGRTGIEGREYHGDDGEPVIDFGAGDDQGVKARLAAERFAENLRLLYVALTRAVHRCVVVVGSYESSRSGREGAASPLHWLVAGGGRTPAQWLDKERKDVLTPAQAALAWRDFAAAHPGAVALDPLPGGPWAALAPSHIEPDAIAALPAPARIPPAWWTGSYSSLTAGARRETAALDHDARTGAADGSDDAADAVAGEPRADDDILDFPRGAAAGSCLHAVFEHADFTDAATWPMAIADALRDLPPGPPDTDPGRHARMLARMLADVLATPLPGGLVLARVPPAFRLSELEFFLPATAVSADALAAVLRAHGLTPPALAFGMLDGFLRGFIDAVVEHDGRYYVIDWKSNHLGHRRADYRPSALAAAMQAQGYRLQALLYALALHRLLGERLPDYRFDTHFGGAVYLFVRGVRPGWVEADGAPAGVHVERPSAALVEALSALFGHVGAVA